MCVVLEIETRLMSRPVKSETKILEISEAGQPNLGSH